MLSMDISIICSIVRLGMVNLPSLKQKMQYSFVVEPSTIVDSMVEEINAFCMETTESFTYANAAIVVQDTDPSLGSAQGLGGLGIFLDIQPRFD